MEKVCIQPYYRKAYYYETDQMGIVEAEQFISFVIREKFDYTKWQRGYFDRKTPEEISREASDFEQAHPFSGNAIRL